MLETSLAGVGRPSSPAAPQASLEPRHASNRDRLGSGVTRARRSLADALFIIFHKDSIINAYTQARCVILSARPVRSR